MNRFLALIAVLVMLTVCAGAQSFALPGTPDRELGRRGYVTEIVSDQTRIVIPIDAVGNPDGSFIVVSSAVAVFPGAGVPIRFHLTKYEAGGARDFSFGVGGEVDDAFPGTASPVSAVVQTDGKIVVAGNIRDAGIPTDFLVARYHADGRRDLDFGLGGFVRADFGSLGTTSADVVKRVFVHADGKISLVGHRVVSDGFDPANDFVAVAALRLHSDGTPDFSFGTDGKASSVELAVGGQFAMSDIRMLSNGGFLLGFAGREKANSEVVSKLLKLNVDAIPDANFGDRGYLNLAAGGVMTPVGETRNGDLAISSPAGLLAIKSDGSLRGWMMSDSTIVNGAVFRPHSYLSDEHGSVICFGTSERSGTRRQAMIRFFADGRGDTSFGTNGLREEAFDVSSMRSARNILTPNGKILAIRQSTDFNRVLIQRWHGAASAPTMSRVLKESLFK